MLGLFLIVHIFVGAVLAGSAVIAALLLGFDTLQPLVIATLLGLVVSIPVSWTVAKRISG